MSTPLSHILARLLSSRPSTRSAVAGAVYDEDATTLAVILADLGLDPHAAEHLLDEPGPFLPRVGVT